MERQNVPTSALYVRLPAEEALKLDRAAAALSSAKKDLVTDLVACYVDPDSPEGLDRLRALRGGRFPAPLEAIGPESDEARPAVGRHSFRAAEPPEVLTPEQAAGLLQVDEASVLELAEAGRLPGQRIAGQWRFARTALLAWLSGASTSPE